jgi:thiol-disulfide isomerase/thioredoxin
VGLQSGAPRVGQPAPEFSAKLLDGLPIDEQIFIGNHTVLNFWATWCAPCQQEMPVLQAASQDHPTELQVIGMNVGESLQQITPFLESYGINFDIAMDNDGSVQRNYAVLGLPITFFIDPEGTIIAQHVGGLTETQMLGYLEKLGVGSD